MTRVVRVRCDGRPDCPARFTLDPGQASRQQLALAGWTTADRGDLCPACSKPTIPGQRAAIPVRGGYVGPEWAGMPFHVLDQAAPCPASSIAVGGRIDPPIELVVSGPGLVTYDGRELRWTSTTTAPGLPEPCPSALALCSIPCGCAGSNPSHRLPVGTA